MKTKKTIKALTTAFVGGSLIASGVFVGAKKDTKEVKADEKTYYSRDFSQEAAKDYADDEVSALGFYDGHLLSTSSALMNTNGNSQKGPYYVIKVDTEEGNYLTSLKLSGKGRFYYNSGENTVWEEFYLSTDPTNFGSPVDLTKCLYGAYTTRTQINVDFTEYIPAETSTIYIKFLLHAESTGLGFSRDWTKWTSISVTGTEVAKANYTYNKSFKKVVSEDFTKTAVAQGISTSYQNVSNASSSHGLVPGFWGDPVTICDDLESNVVYYIPTNGNTISSVKVNINAKIWNQNNDTCHANNKIQVWAGKDLKSLTMVKEFGCQGDQFVDLEEVNAVTPVEGEKAVYVKVVMIQSNAAKSGDGTKDINGVTHNAFKYGLSGLGVKIAKIDITVEGKYVCPETAQTYLEKDFTNCDQTALADALDVTTNLKCGNPEGSYWGIYNSNPANKESLVYKVEAKEEGAFINSLVFAFTDSRFAYYSGSYGTEIKLFVSKDRTNYVEAGQMDAPKSAISSASFDLSKAVYDLKSSVVYVKIEIGTRFPGCGCTAAWITLTKISLKGGEATHNFEASGDPVAATCSEAGSQHFVCADCGMEIDKEIPMTGHTYEHVDEVSATVDTDGVKEHYICSECEKLFTKVDEVYTEVNASDLVIPKTLPTYKTNAKDELDTYYGEFTLTDYRTAQQNELATALSNGKAAVDSASNKAGVDKAVADAKAAMDAVKTDAQMTEAAKTLASTFEAAVDAITATDYSQNFLNQVATALSLYNSLTEEAETFVSETKMDKFNALYSAYYYVFNNRTGLGVFYQQQAQLMSSEARDEELYGVFTEEAEKVIAAAYAQAKDDTEEAHAIYDAYLAAIDAIEAVPMFIEDEISAIPEVIDLTATFVIQTSQTETQTLSLEQYIEYLEEEIAYYGTTQASWILEYVDNEAYLTDAKAAVVVAKLIDEIGEVTLTDTSKTAIDAARNAFDALTDTQKARVDTTGLLAAEKAYADLVAAKELADYKETKAGELQAAYEALDLTKYTTENQAALATAFSEGTDAINAAVDKDAVDAALAAAKAALAAVPEIVPEEPAKEKSGCGGSIIAASGLVTLVTLLGAGLLASKRKED